MQVMTWPLNLEISRSLYGINTSAEIGYDNAHQRPSPVDRQRHTRSDS